MPVTVEHILRLGSLSEAKVLAGSGGLGHAVSSVTVGEVPDIADWLSGGEIVLSTMFALIDDPARQQDFCRRIMSAGAAALLVKPQRFVGEFPPSVLETADRRGFPIIEVPQEIRWTRIMQEAMEVLIDRHASLLEKSQNIHRQLLEVVIRGGGWEEIAEAAAALVDKPVAILDVSLEPLGVSADSRWTGEDIYELVDAPGVREELTEPRESREMLFQLHLEGGLAAFVVPVIVSHSRLGYVCAFSEASGLEELERVALENAATVAAVEMARDQARFETEVRLKGDFVDDLIGGRFSSADSLLRRASFLGCDLSKGATVLIADFDDFESGVVHRQMREEDIQRLKNRFFNRCTRLAAGAEPSSLVSLKSDHVICFLAGPLAEDRRGLNRVALQIQALGQEVVGLPVSVGISRHAGELEALRNAFDEAMTALKVGRKLEGESSVMHFDGAGTYRLLLSSFEQDPEELRLLYAETIEPLERYDAENGSHLVETLRTYLERDGNLSQTAKELYAHRHTIRYRLQKIGEITGLDVFGSEGRERLGLGLKARSLLTV